jgi:hypothetical protein
MTLKDFLKEVNGREEDIKNLSGEAALVAVKQSGYILRFVKDQTPEICLAAVKENSYALQYVKEQTPEICLEAVRKNGDALKYVDKSIFDKEEKVLTVREIEEILGYSIKIVKE